MGSSENVLQVHGKESFLVLCNNQRYLMKSEWIEEIYNFSTNYIDAVNKKYDRLKIRLIRG